MGHKDDLINWGFYKNVISRHTCMSQEHGELKELVDFVFTGMSYESMQYHVINQATHISHDIFLIQILNKSS